MEVGVASSCVRVRGTARRRGCILSGLHGLTTGDVRPQASMCVQTSPAQRVRRLPFNPQVAATPLRLKLRTKLDFIKAKSHLLRRLDPTQLNSPIGVKYVN